MTPGVAASECIRLVREAVAASDANLGAIRHPEDRSDRLPTLNLETWYQRARAAVAALDADREARL